MTIAQSRYSSIVLQPPRRMRTPLRLALAVGLLLLCAVGVAALHTVTEESKRMQADMKSRADVLIWAMEGAGRSLMQMGRQHSGQYRQSFVQELSRQPNIAYFAVTDASGRVVAHSDPEEIGRELFAPEEFELLKGLRESLGNFVERDGERVYEVAKPFTPTFARGYMRGMRRHSFGSPDDAGGQGMHGYGAGGFGGQNAQEGAEQAGKGFGRTRSMPADTGLYIFVGMDTADFDAAYRSNVLVSVLLSLGIALAGMAGLFLWTFAQNYRTSHRMLRDVQSLALQIFENLPIGIFTTDPNGAVTLCNRHSARMLFGDTEEKADQEKSDLTKTRPTSVSLRDHPLWGKRGLMGELDRGVPVAERELSLALPGEPAVPVSVSAVSLQRSLHHNDEALGYLFMLRDLAEIRHLQEQIRRSRHLTALGNMAAGVAHEIRNPLSTIKGYAHYMAEKFAETDPAGMTATMMIREVERLNRVVSDLLAVARIGSLSLREEPLLPAVLHALRLVDPEAREKGVALYFVGSPATHPAAPSALFTGEQSMDADRGEGTGAVAVIDSTVPARMGTIRDRDTGTGAVMDADSAMGRDVRVCMDADRFVQALLNLLINAVQATDAGGSVRVSVEEGSAEEDMVRVTVADSGIGMSQEVLSQLFTPYFTTKDTGTGLGLTITHRIIEQHGGEIRVESLPGQGSVFTLSLRKH